MKDVALVHLVWAPLGTAPLARFLAAHAAHPPGVPHRLILVFNGFERETAAAGHRALLCDVEHEAFMLSRPQQDLAAYLVAARHAGPVRLAFLNSYAEPLVEGWLGLLLDVLDRPDAGIVAATGSYESAASAAPRPLKPLKRLGHPPFPNPHLRTNAFALDHDVLARLDWRAPRGKAAALRLESGHRGLTRQVQSLGLSPLVAGRDGRAFDVPEWPASRTFRSGDQENLLVADNRTRQYADAGPAERRRLAAIAWGEA